MTIRVVVADDQELVRAGFAAVLRTQPDLEVVGEAADGREAVDEVRRHRPDVVLMDVRMPRVDGIAATREICGDPRSSARVLVLTTFDLDEYVLAALRAGASGFLLKDAPRESLYAAVRTVAQGDALLAPSVTRRLIERHLRIDEPPAGAASTAGRVDRPRARGAALLARGLTNAEIAAALHLGEPDRPHPRGPDLHQGAVRDRAQAVVFAYESELVRSGHTSGA